MVQTAKLCRSVAKLTRLTILGVIMNRFCGIGFAFALASVTLEGCSPFMTRTEPTPETDRIAVYESSDPKLMQFNIVKRLWIESWRSVFTVPYYASVNAGKADLQRQALALGGDAIINFGCAQFKPNPTPEPKPPFFCNGTVIKYVR